MKPGNFLTLLGPVLIARLPSKPITKLGKYFLFFLGLLQGDAKE